MKLIHRRHLPELLCQCIDEVLKVDEANVPTYWSCYVKLNEDNCDLTRLENSSYQVGTKKSIHQLIFEGLVNEKINR